jgi:hypothetical protein
LVASNLGSDNVSVFLGNGDGTFGTRADFATGNLPLGVAVRDLNGDGKPDLAIANGGSDNVSVLLGNGDGTFGARTDYPTGLNPRSVAIEDLNADGKPDIAVANNGPFTVTVLLGNGDGTFGSKLSYGTGANPVALAIGDMNRDGKPDIVTSNNSSGTVSILRNLGPAAPLLARAFVVGNRAVPIGSGPPNLCVQIEPIDGSFALSDVDLSTVSMISEGTGAVSRIPSAASRQSQSTDMDRNGVPEISACFARADLARLFSSVQGRREIGAVVEGRLNTGAGFSATLQLTVLGRRGGAGVALVSPNPMNPRGVLRFATRAPGYVTARLFDLSGRLVRTIAQSKPLEAGDHELVIDGHDAAGAPLASGVYFYRIETPDGLAGGRFVVAR